MGMGIFEPVSQSEFSDLLGVLEGVGIVSLSLSPFHCLFLPLLLDCHQVLAREERPSVILHRLENSAGAGAIPRSFPLFFLFFALLMCGHQRCRFS